MRSYTKFGPDRFSRFDVYGIQTNKQTERQTKFKWRKGKGICLHFSESMNYQENSGTLYGVGLE